MREDGGRAGRRGRKGAYGREPERLDQLGHGHAARKVAELDLDELLGVERPMPVPALGHGPWEHHSGGVHGLERVLAVDPPGDLSDEHWCQAMAPKLLMHAQEVDLDQELRAIGERVSAGRTRECQQGLSRT